MKTELQNSTLSNLLKTPQFERPDASVAQHASERANASDSARDEFVRSDSGKGGASGKEAEQILKLSTDLSEKQQVSSSNILKILSENAPNVLKSLREIISSLSGEQQDKPTVDLEKFEKALKAASGSPDPSRRSAQVVDGLKIAPDAIKNAFLEGSEKVLNAEAALARNAVSSREGQRNVAINETSGIYQAGPGATSIKVNFDLFFSASAKYSISSGENANGSFYEASAEMTTRFSSNFSIEVGGRFLSMADAAADIDPKILEAFSDATRGLAGLDDDALERFFDAAEELFGEVEDALGLAEGSLDGTAEQIKSTAASFFASVSSAAEETFPGLKLDQIFSLPKHLDNNGSTDLLTLLSNAFDNDDAEEKSQSLAQQLLGAENARALGSEIPTELPELRTAA